MYYDKRTEIEPVVSPAKPAPYPEPWQQSLLEAAQYIRKYGWCQLENQTEQGGVCLVVSMQITDPAQWRIGYEIIRAALNRSPVAWNDTKSRTKEEVIAVLEKATGL